MGKAVSTGREQFDCTAGTPSGTNVERDLKL